MQIKCYRCSTSFHLNKDQAAAGLADLEQNEGKHFGMQCPKCRTTNRISLEQLRRAVPRPAADPTQGTS